MTFSNAWLDNKQPIEWSQYRSWRHTEVITITWSTLTNETISVKNTAWVKPKRIRMITTLSWSGNTGFGSHWDWIIDWTQKCIRSRLPWREAWIDENNAWRKEINWAWYLTYNISKADKDEIIIKQTQVWLAYDRTIYIHMTLYF